MQHSQTITAGPQDKPSWEHWTELEIRTYNGSAEPASRVRFEGHKEWKTLDVKLEEYVGISRRAKYTSVRLDEAGARALLQLLQLQFGAPAREQMPWVSEDDRALMHLVLARKDWLEIAAALERSADAVKHRALELGLVTHAQAKRPRAVTR